MNGDKVFKRSGGRSVSQVVAVLSVLAGALLFLATPDAMAENIDGTPGPDVLNGNDGESDTIDGGGGDDLINGGDETAPDGDSLLGGDGDDVLNGEGGNDRIEGGAGHDVISGGADDDDLIGDASVCGSPVALDGATPANGVVECVGGDDFVGGDGGSDGMIGDNLVCDGLVPFDGATPAVEQPACIGGADQLVGGDGDDLLIGDLIECFRGQIFLGSLDGATALEVTSSCVGGADILVGGSGNDILFGDEFFPVDRPCNGTTPKCGPAGGDDLIDGGSGNDYAEGGGGSDEVSGGDGNDFLLGDQSPFLVLLLSLEGDNGEANRFGLLGDNFDPATFDDATLDALFELLLDHQSADDGDDIVTGDAGADILAGGGGNDVVCGDLDDIMLVGGPGTDLPCPVFTGILDATGGPVSGDLSTDIRDLDDEFAESGPVDMSGVLEAGGLIEANPYEFVIITAPTKGTVTFDPVTGEFTYVPDDGATGVDSFEYTIRRELLGADGAAQVVNGEDGYVYSIARIVQFLLGDPPTPANPINPRVVAISATPLRTGAQLPVTGVETTGLALIGFGMLLFGSLAFTESRRRENSLMRSHARHLARP